MLCLVLALLPLFGLWPYISSTSCHQNVFILGRSPAMRRFVSEIWRSCGNQKLFQVACGGNIGLKFYEFVKCLNQIYIHASWKKNPQRKVPFKVPGIYQKRFAKETNTKFLWLLQVITACEKALQWRIVLELLHDGFLALQRSYGETGCVQCSVLVHFCLVKRSGCRRLNRENIKVFNCYTCMTVGERERETAGNKSILKIDIPFGVAWYCSVKLGQPAELVNKRCACWQGHLMQ